MAKHSEKIKKALEQMETLTRRISELLLQHRGRRLTTADDLVLRYLEFIQVELSGIVVSLSQMCSLSQLRPDCADEGLSDCADEGLSDCADKGLSDCADEGLSDCADEGLSDCADDGRLSDWLSFWAELSSTWPIVFDMEQATLHGCRAQLHRAAARCFSRHPGLPLRLQGVQQYLHRLNLFTESPSRYKHLLLDDDGDRNSRTSSSYAADAGGNMFLVGIEGALRNKKLRWFMADRKENETVRVISMVGPAGVGKTTLAMEVYRQLQQIQGNCFQCCATAKVSQRSDSKELLKHILSQIHKPPALLEASMKRSQITTQEDEELKLLADNMELKLLAGNINQCLQEKRYLILIDNILKKSDWRIIKNAFPQNSTGSRIIITTQLRSVGQFCCSHYDGLVYEVKPLGPLDSERLLFREVFGSKDGCLPENLQRVCDEILERSEGIPLFITGMADWLKEQRRELQHIIYDDLMEIVPKLPRQVEQSLAIINDDLPNHLKVFLMCMSMFQGYMFDKYSLSHKFIYQRIFPNVEAQYFSKLVDRNVITRVAATHEHTHEMEEACAWQVNYFILQFVASKSADRGFLCTSGTLHTVAAQKGKNPRKMSLHQPDPELPRLLGKMDLSHTRSLAISGKVNGIPLDKFIYLVMLDLTGWQRFKEEDMVSICKMFLLRHLSLRCTGIRKLPPAIKELQLLDTLDVSHTQISELPLQLYQMPRLKRLDLRSTQLRQLPEQIWKLRSLECLLVGGDGVNRDETVKIPEGIKRFMCLTTLATVDLTQCSPSLVDALGLVRRLQVLAITWSFHQCTDGRFQKALRSSIQQWSCLESLTILCGFGCCMDFLDYLIVSSHRLEKFKVPGGRFARPPGWFRELYSLTFIEITVCTLLPDDVGILGNMPRLECLVLGLNFIPEAEIVIDGVGFQKLERLSVCCRVPRLTFMQGAMPVLTFLELKIAGSPASQESIPTGISNVRRLSDVAIRYHANYINSPNVKMTVEAVRKAAAQHFNPINLFINGILEEYLEAVEEDSTRATGSQSEIQTEGCQCPTTRGKITTSAHSFCYP